MHISIGIILLVLLLLFIFRRSIASFIGLVAVCIIFSGAKLFPSRRRSKSDNTVVFAKVFLVISCIAIGVAYWLRR